MGAETSRPTRYRSSRGMGMARMGDYNDPRGMRMRGANLPPPRGNSRAEMLKRMYPSEWAAAQQRYGPSPEDDRARRRDEGLPFGGDPYKMRDYLDEQGYEGHSWGSALTAGMPMPRYGKSGKEGRRSRRREYDDYDDYDDYEDMGRGLRGGSGRSRGPPPPDDYDDYEDCGGGGRSRGGGRRSRGPPPDDYGRSGSFGGGYGRSGSYGGGGYRDDYEDPYGDGRGGGRRGGGGDYGRAPSPTPSEKYGARKRGMGGGGGRRRMSYGGWDW